MDQDPSFGEFELPSETQIQFRTRSGSLYTLTPVYYDCFGEKEGFPAFHGGPIKGHSEVLLGRPVFLYVDGFRKGDKVIITSPVEEIL